MYYVTVLVVLFLLVLYYTQESSKSCDYVLKMPNPNLIRRWLPKGTEEINGGDLDPLNDRITEHYMGNPYGHLKKEGMGDVTTGLWGATTSHPGKSNDGRTVQEGHVLTDMISPEFRNTIASKTHELAQVAANSSRLESFQMEGSSPSHPWSQ